MCCLFNETCKECGMEMNVKNTEMMVITQTGNVCCKIMVDDTMLE